MGGIECPDIPCVSVDGPEREASSACDTAESKPSLLHPIRCFRRFMRSCSLKTAFVVYAVAATIIALVVSTFAASLLASQASEIWYTYSERSGMYLYSEAKDALVPAESLSWYTEGGDPVYVEASGLDEPDPIPIDKAAEAERGMRVYDGRILSDEQLENGATEGSLELSSLPAYNSRQLSLLGDGASSDAEALDMLPPNDEGEVPAWSPVSYYVTFQSTNGAYDALQLMAFLVFPVVFVAVFVVAARLFYRSNLKRPISAMDDAAQRIASSDLDFKLVADSENELGHLVGSFEDMRSALEANNRAMWRMIESRKQTNAAFAHDLRTPLTVLKGHVEMLSTYARKGALSPEQIEDMARACQRQVVRIERYVGDMRDLAKLEDAAVVSEDTATSELIERLAESARALASENGKRFEAMASALPDTVHLDAAVVSRIVENLLANAVRYAEGSVVLSCSAAGADLVVTVEDDGPGFSDEALSRGLEPYYRDTSRSDSSEHFGLGLGICAVLAAKCEGSVSLSNRVPHGACAAVRFPGVFKR
ncbi:sensor histidine kinase [Raoultibacter phocaeensis]|uniref:sensor histidine kinase n=1 Tax=Raoultibacter phocaeensis TaxID=2479841 RepID=UPI00111A4774|nr:HAMP domain-containing sensor histidine kinase [Raoultibacter phocaeensis]